MKEENTHINLADYFNAAKPKDCYRGFRKPPFEAFQIQGSAAGQDVFSTTAVNSATPCEGLDMYGSSDSAVFPVVGVNELRCSDPREQMSGVHNLNPPYSTLRSPGIDSASSRGRKFALHENHAMFDRNGGMWASGGVNFVNGSSQQLASAENTLKQFLPAGRIDCMPPAPPNCPQTVNVNPIAGLSELTEKANFSSELGAFGDTRSGFRSRESRVNINRLSAPFDYPGNPNSGNWRSEKAEGFFETRQSRFHGSFVPSLPTIGPESSETQPYQDNSPLPNRSTCHSARPQQWSFNESTPESAAKDNTHPQSENLKAHNEDLRSFANYRLWSSQAEAAITPNVTVVQDPKSKFSQFFTSGRTKSEQILKDHLSTFGKFLSPAEGEDKKLQTSESEKEWENSTNVAKKEKTASDSSRKNSNTSEEENRVFGCKWLGCDVIYSEQDDLVRHIEKVHIDQRKADDLYICYWEGCSRQTKPFNARYKLVIHMRVHSGEKPNKCTVSKLKLQTHYAFVFVFVLFLCVCESGALSHLDDSKVYLSKTQVFEKLGCVSFPNYKYCNTFVLKINCLVINLLSSDHVEKVTRALMTSLSTPRPESRSIHTSLTSGNIFRHSTAHILLGFGRILVTFEDSVLVTFA